MPGIAIAPRSHSFRSLLRWASLAALALGGLGPGLPAQTAFTGQWTEWSQSPVYGSPYSVYAQPAPSNAYVFMYRPILQVDLLGNKSTLLHWRVWPVVVPGQAGGSFVSGSWSTTQAWSDGLPDLNADAWIMDTHDASTVALNGGAIQLPGLNQTAATARSLTVFDAHDSGDQHVQFGGGTLNLTPLAFNESFRVGVASGNVAQARATTVTLDAMTLTSAGIAMIGGGGPPGAAGPVSGSLSLRNGAQWLHPVGLIEVGGGDGTGTLTVESGGLLAGSLLPGAATDPQLVLRSGSSFQTATTSVVRLSELTINSGHWEPGLAPSQWGSLVMGDLDAGLLHLGQGTQGTAWFSSSSSARFGQVVIESSSWLELRGSASADTVDLHDGVIYAAAGELTVGTVGGPGTTTVMQLGRDTGDSGLMLLSSPSAVTVHGTLEVGRDGHGNLLVPSGSTMTVNGDLAIAGNGTGESELNVHGTVAARNVQAGTNGSDMDYGGGGPFPAGQATIRLDGGTLNVTGTSEEVAWPFPATINNPGTLNLGTDDLLEGNGTIAFTNPTGGQLMAVGAVAPGLAGMFLDHTGELLVQGDLKLANAPFALTRAFGTLKVEIGGAAAGQFDVLHVTGNADIDGATLEISLLDGFSPAAGASFHFLAVDGTLNGMFASLVDHTGAGLTLADLTVMETGGLGLTFPAAAVPEPAIGALLAGLGALGPAGWRRRRRRPATATGGGT